MSKLSVLPCMDSPGMAASCRQVLNISRNVAAALGKSAVDAATSGRYTCEDGREVVWGSAVETACAAKVSIRPDAELVASGQAAFPTTRVQVSNETTLQAAKRLFDCGDHPVALNFANGVTPGGGFLNGARAQEETLCRSSSLHSTLVGDPMYDFHRHRHRQRPQPDSSDCLILSPGVPVFRDDRGTSLEQHWPLSFVTCAAPHAYTIGQPESGELLSGRIQRVLSVARAYGYEALVLGAWGCGAFGNDAIRTAKDFRSALRGDLAGAFKEVIFAVADWSPERIFLQPFREAFSD